MSVRDMIERQELKLLSPFAAKSALSRGRERDLSPCDLRTDFQRDRDRILHSKSFRRLQFKTQVFLSPEGDHYRTRLTHTLEVAQVARTLARALKLNEDLTEAIALGHDLGHTPFGHIGEKTLNRLCTNGFKHNEQSLRVVDILEGEHGLNLSFEVRDGILNHSGGGNPMTQEGCIVARADRIAYINHDIDDALRAGAIKPSDLPRACIRVLGSSHGDRIDTMIRDIVDASRDKPAISSSSPVQEATDTLRSFLFEKVYSNHLRQEEAKKCDRVLESLFLHFMEHREDMPDELKSVSFREGTQRAVADYIASMTDRFAMRAYHAYFLPDSFPIPPDPWAGRVSTGKGR